MKQGISQADINRALDKVRKELEPKKNNLIPGLQLIQGELGYLPGGAMTGLSRYLKVRESEVWGTASFYTQFRFTPVGRNIMTVCRGTACHVRGSASILRELERQLGIKPGETTADLNFTLQQVACFGSCALAPVIVVNGRVYGRQTTTSAKGLLGTLKKSSPARVKGKKRSKSKR
jgi:NADH-quinone oxidoreductase subunit E